MWCRWMIRIDRAAKAIVEAGTFLEEAVDVTRTSRDAVLHDARRVIVAMIVYQYVEMRGKNDNKIDDYMNLKTRK